MNQTNQIWKNPKIWTLAIAETLVWSGQFYLFPALLLQWNQSFEWSVSLISGAFSISLLASAFFSIFVGRIIDRGKGRILMTLSALIGGLILIFLSQIQTIGLFYLSWLLLGLTTSGCLYPACFSYLTNVYKDDAKRPIMLVTLLGGFAGTICYPITSYYVELFDWQFAAIFWGLVNIFICAPLFRYSNLEKTFQIQKNVSKNEKLNRLEILKFFKNPIFILIAISFTLVATNNGMVVSQIFPSLESRGFSIVLTVFFASLFGPAQVASRLLVFILDSFDRTKFSVSILFPVALFIMGFASILFMIGKGNFVLIFLFVVIQGGAWGLMSFMTPEVTWKFLGFKNFALILALVSFGGKIGAAFAPLLAGFLGQYFGYNILMLVTGLLVIIAGVSFLIVLLITNYSNRILGSKIA